VLPGVPTSLGVVHEVGSLTEAFAGNAGQFTGSGPVLKITCLAGRLPGSSSFVDDSPPPGHASGTQLPWKPKGTRWGSSMLATGGAAMSAASRITSSERSVAASWR
jgi:hypothetical protein